MQERADNKMRSGDLTMAQAGADNHKIICFKVICFFYIIFTHGYYSHMHIPPQLSADSENT